MARSIKKGPYVFERLLKRVRALNESGKKEVIKTWSRRSTIYSEFIGHTFAVSLFMMEENMYRYTLQKIWLDTN